MPFEKLEEQELGKGRHGGSWMTDGAPPRPSIGHGLRKARRASQAAADRRGWV